jgi:hypothetical protein
MQVLCQHLAALSRVMKKPPVSLSCTGCQLGRRLVATGEIQPARTKQAPAGMRPTGIRPSQVQTGCTNFVLSDLDFCDNHFPQFSVIMTPTETTRTRASAETT